ncbi:DnaJ domain protein [Rhizoctonia solani]|uniref:DnaJ domain protein n=1 Tax=Rhizoctonia solani TaxID=456999 RepID=A0A8H8NQV6_9AGAM|nr:DnaJ domain protein [Rhizoctonia solani]QRW16935.1 DnaJ domain protein [Rhizoctonia solani]
MASHLYETLNLGMNATPDEIRKAYKKLALKTHPDRAPPERKLEAEEEFRKVNAAYEVLIDEEKRRIYDRNGVYPPPEPATENAYSNPYSPPPLDPSLHQLSRAPVSNGIHAGMPQTGSLRANV